jgi:glyoxylase-like metal-dependent hydrolase (beta-lactamase superfamily II)
VIGTPKIIEMASNTVVVQNFNPHQKLWDVHAGMIFTGEGVVFFDSGFNLQCAEYLWNVAEDHFDVSSHSKNFLVLSHHHYDHTFGMEFFRNKGVPIVASSKMRDYVRQDTRYYVDAVVKERANLGATYSMFVDVSLSLPQLLLNQDLTYTFGDYHLQILLTPGHTDDSLCLYDPQSGILMTGDSLFVQPASPTIPMADVSKEIHIESLQKLKTLTPKTIFPGHGDILQHPIDVLNALINRYRVSNKA